MVAALYLSVLSFLIFTIAASPLPNQGFSFLPVDPNQLFCQLPVVSKVLCSRASNVVAVQTPIGTAYGNQDSSGASRFTVKYASAGRWAPSKISSTWANSNITLPLACPQPNIDASKYTEDCLYLILYIPPYLTPGSNASTLMWIHGGSFVAGSATGPGLGGSNLAIATNSIVAVVQYRLGALGFMAPSGTTNLAVKDIVNALKFLQKVVPSFGGGASKITIAGQSSGANMIRALLAVPSASSLFKSAILQSDPMNYGFLSLGTQATLQRNFNQLIGCCPTETTCLNALSLDQILAAQGTLFQTAPSLDPSTGAAEPIRPVRDGSFITSPLDSTAPFPSTNKSLLISTVINEAGLAIYGQFPSPLPPNSFAFISNATLGENRTEMIMGSNFYPPVTGANGEVDARTQLQSLGTDYLWRCSSWTFARNWVYNNGIAYVGEYQIGASYPGNSVVPYCINAGVVCHQDDIQIVFGTVANPTPAQTALTKEMQARYKSFMATGNPNTVGFSSWAAATSVDVHPLLLGGSGEAPVGACSPSFWGAAVQYDYQVYGI